MTLLGCLVSSVVLLVVLFILVYWVLIPPFAALWHGLSSLWRSGRENIAPRVESAWFEFQTRSGEHPDEEFELVPEEPGEPGSTSYEAPEISVLPPLPPPPVPDPPEIER